MTHFAETELILTAQNRVYHLNLCNDDIAENVILVGDQNRVAQISKYFSKIDFKTEHREFITHTGTFNGKRLTVLSTGIGTDNIDIVVNELDAAVNIDLDKRALKKTLRRLNLIRLGTSGALQSDLPINGLVAGSHGLGMDGLLHFYAGLKEIDEEEVTEAFKQQCHWAPSLPQPYCVAANEDLLKHFSNDVYTGITATAPGFYGPQGRQIRLKVAMPDLNKKLAEFRWDHLRITNFEMETSALYGLGKLLKHRCLTLCVIIANRERKEFTKDYHKSVEHLIEHTLNKLSDIS